MEIKSFVDAGVIIDGEVSKNSETGELSITDDDGDVFYPERVLSSLVGKKVRMTVISFEALESMENVYKSALSSMCDND
jgi:predicted PilT family ATPase